MVWAPAKAATGTKTRKKAARRPKKPQFTSRGVTRPVEAGSAVDCAHCGERVKFRAKVRQYQVICNVYVDGRWDHVEHFHAPCYDEAGRPFGDPVD